MKSRLALIIITLVFIFSSINVSATELPVSLIINGKAVVLPANVGKPFLKDGEYMVPAVKAVLEPMGITYGYDVKNKLLTLKREDTTSVYDLNNKQLKVNGVQRKLYGTPINVNGWIYIPASSLMAMHYKLNYIEKQSMIEISLENTYTKITEKDGMLIVDISNLTAPKYDNGYSQIDVYDGLVGFNKNSTVGKRPNGSTMDEDMEHFNKTILKNTKTVFAGGGTYDIMGQGVDYLNSTLSIRRDGENPVIQIRDWAESDGEHDNFRYQATMNCVAEMLRYYCRNQENAEGIWLYIDNAVKARKNIATDKPYLFGETKVKFVDPMTFGIDIVILN